MSVALLRNGLWAVVALMVSVGCGSAGPGTAPAPAPAREPLAAAPAAGTPEATAPDTVRPGRFDTGKMWTFENPPLDYFEEAYAFRPSAEWLLRARLAALRLPNCTASFVSPDGLVMSNHHCARESATAVSLPDEDLLANGFYASRPADERRVPDLHVDQLVEIRDVTAEVDRAAASRRGDAEQAAARDSAAGAIGERLGGELGLVCEVTSLYYGGRFSAYCYRRYEDVRLVFVPEGAVGYFGGDPDNFTYPRYAFDVSFFRVYGDDGRPLTAEHWFSWSDHGAREGDPVFVIGNPGSTSRLNTMAQLEYKRDLQYPFTIRLLESRAAILAQHMERFPETRSELINDYFSLTNSLKAYRGELAGLETPTLLARKAAFERDFRAAVAADSALARQYGRLWTEIADLRRRIARISPELNGLNQGGMVRSATLLAAAQLLQYGPAAASGQVPADVLSEFRAEVEAVAIDPELERSMLAAQLADAQALLGEDDPFVRAALAGRTPEEAARALLDASVVDDSTGRADLLDRPSAIATSADPALTLMRQALPRLQRVSQDYQQLIAQEEARTARLARALFEVYGTDIPPDATFTLRLADGLVAGYDYNGTRAPAFTTFYGMYDRNASHGGREEWALPERWIKPGPDFDLSTPLNLVTTNDIIGGNSGSPLINTAGELVGLIFDGNIESLPGDFIYTTEVARAVSVHSAGILEALRDLYRAERLVAEIEGARRPAR